MRTLARLIARWLWGAGGVGHNPVVEDVWFCGSADYLHVHRSRAEIDACRREKP